MNTRDGFEFAFPAVKGVQAGRPYYIAMFPLCLIPKILLFDEREVPATLRSQRQLNESRIPEMAEYIVNNPTSYIFSSLTVSIDATVRFEASSDSLGNTLKSGTLHLPMTSTFVINDGQHRRAAIQKALETTPELGNETISVVIFSDLGLERSQQMFADLNRYAVKPTPSLNVLYDRRDPLAEITRTIVSRSNFLRGVTELEKNSLATRSRKLFTLAALHSANGALLKNQSIEDTALSIHLGTEFWNAVIPNMPLWRAVGEGRISAGEVRKEYISSHAVVLHALGVVGNKMVGSNGELSELSALCRLKDIDWRRTNAEVWEGVALIDGSVSKSRKNVELTAKYISQVIGIEFDKEG